MQHTIYIRDELILEANFDTEAPHILLKRAGEPDEVRYLADALCAMAAGMAGFLAGDEESEGHI